MYEFKRDDELSEKGTWRPSSDKAIIACPMCGCFGGLGKHDIAADGRITPSLVCPWAPCTFHDMGRLLNWKS